MRTPWLLTAALILTPAVSQAKTLEELLIEKGVVTPEELKSTSAPAKLSWNDGTMVEFPDQGFSAKLALFLVERYTYTNFDSDSGRSDTSSFDQNKARLNLSGTALDKQVNYFFSGDFIGEKEEGTSEPRMKDAYVQWNPLKTIGLRMGQYKTLVSKQWNVAEHKQLLPDRSVASQYFMLERNQGITGSWSTEDSSVVAKAGMFNGDSTGEGPARAGIDTDHSGMASIRYNPLEKFDVGDETDIDYTQNLALTFGAAYAYSSSRMDVGTEDEPLREHLDLQRLSVDAGAKIEGLSAAAEFFWGDNDWDNSDSGSPIGFYAQAGYFVMPKCVEVAARYSMVDCDDGKAGGACAGADTLDEAAVGLNFYPWKHNLQLSGAYIWSQEDPVEGSSEDTNKIIGQISSYF